MKQRNILSDDERKTLTHLYSAYIYIPKDPSEQAKGEIKSMEIESYDELHDVYIMTAPYFTSKGYSTSRLYRQSTDLDTELKISDKLTVFYSEDKEQCSDWLHGKYMSLFEEAKARYEQLASILIQDQTLDATKEAPLTR